MRPAVTSETVGANGLQIKNPWGVRHAVEGNGLPTYIGPSGYPLFLRGLARLNCCPRSKFPLFWVERVTANTPKYAHNVQLLGVH